MPEGSDLELDIRLEGVSEGVLVTAAVLAPVAGECARCLDPFASTMRVRFQELFGSGASSDDAGEDGYRLEGDLLDLEPALRDALVLEMPLSPLCAADCRGLCAECGVRLDDAEPDHQHARRGAMWAALQDFRVDRTDSREELSTPDGTGIPDRPPNRTTAPGGVQER